MRCGNLCVFQRIAEIRIDLSLPHLPLQMSKQGEGGGRVRSNVIKAVSKSH